MDSDLFDKINDALAIVFFWFTVAGISLTFLVAILLKPRRRLEWATVGLFGSFCMVLARSYYLSVIVHKPKFSQPFGTIFWIVQCFLVGFYLFSLYLEWQPAIAELRQAAFQTINDYLIRRRKASGDD
jgi:hypothetical protein